MTPHNCPKCGSPAELRVIFGWNNTAGYAVECTRCRFRGPELNAPLAAIESWNGSNLH